MTARDCHFPQDLVAVSPGGPDCKLPRLDVSRAREAGTFQLTQQLRAILLDGDLVNFIRNLFGRRSAPPPAILNDRFEDRRAQRRQLVSGSATLFWFDASSELR